MVSLREGATLLLWFVPEGEVAVKKFRRAFSAIAIDLTPEQASLSTLAMSSAALLATATYKLLASLCGIS